MAIDDNADYTLTGAQVKDLASRIKASGAAALHVYISAAYGTGAIISYSDSGLTTTISAEDVLAAFEDGRQVILHPPSAVDPEAIVINMYSSPEISFDFVANNKKYTYAKVGTNGRWRQLGEDTLVVNDATLTIQHNGTNVQTFTANASSNATANIETIYADPIASTSALTPPVQTNMIADGAVTADKIDFASAVGTAVIKTLSDMSGTRNAIYYADGTLITHRVVTGVVAITTALGSLYYADVPVNDYYALVPTGADDFISKPTVSVTATGSSTQYLWLAFSENSEPQKTSSTGNKWGFKAGSFRIMRATTNNNCNYAINIIAIGRWK